MMRSKNGFALMVLLALSAGLGGQQARAQGVTPTPQQIEQFQNLSEAQRRQLLQMGAQSGAQSSTQTGASSQQQTGDTSVVIPRDVNNSRARFNLPRGRLLKMRYPISRLPPKPD